MNNQPMLKNNDISSAGPSKQFRAYRIYVLVLLTLVYTFNFVDRQIISIVAPAIQADLNLSDGQLGTLIGFWFALFYTTLGIPIARLADKWNRVSIIAISLACWSGFTAISGMAQNFTQLAMARIGVGIGEAGGSPPSHSIISDLYSKQERAGAMGVYALGIPIGITLAFLGGGWVVQNLGWRMAFFAVGIPGVFLAILLKLTVREPKRGGVENTPVNDPFTTVDRKTVNPLWNEIQVLWSAAKHLLSIPSYRWVVVGLTAGSFVTYAIGGWVVVFFKRVHPDYAEANIFLWLGLINGTAYVLGVFAGGNLVDKFAKKNLKAYGIIPALAWMAVLPIYVAFLWVDGPVKSLILVWPFTLLTGFYLGPCFALAQTLAPVSIRALSTAIFLFILNMIALGLGPTYVGIASDILASSFQWGDNLSLRVALTSLIISGAISIFAFYRLTKTIDEDWKKVSSS